MIERRTSPAWRRDLNDIVRDESGKLSGSKMGTLAGQIIAAKYLLEHWEKLITSWDLMCVCFGMLAFPEIVKKIAVLKYGGSDGPTTTTTTATADVTTTTKAKKK